MAPVRSLPIDRAKKNLRELVQDAMREAIIEMRFAPGERLVERSLCAQLGVSRTVVREVLRYLEAEGLIEASPSGGPVVATIKADEAEQIYEIRALLEGTAAAACAKEATTKEIEELALCVAEIEAAYKKRNTQLTLKATHTFYRTMFAVARRRVAWNMVESLHLRINVLRALTSTTPDRHADSIGEMKHIYEAIRSGDTKRARAAAVAHVNEAARIARAVLSDPATPNSTPKRASSRKDV